MARRLELLALFALFCAACLVDQGVSACGGGGWGRITRTEAALFLTAAVVASPLLLVGAVGYVAVGVTGQAALKIQKAKAAADVEQATSHAARVQGVTTDARARTELAAVVGGEDELQRQIQELFTMARERPSFRVHLSLASALYLDSDFLLAERYLKLAISCSAPTFFFRSKVG